MRAEYRCFAQPLVRYLNPPRNGGCCKWHGPMFYPSTFLLHPPLALAPFPNPGDLVKKKKGLFGTIPNAVFLPKAHTYT